MKTVTRVLMGLAALGIAGLGIGAAVVMVVLAPGAGSQDEVESSVPVEVMPANPERIEAVLQLTGSVEPARQVALSPEVAGRVAWIDPRLRPGGRLDEGDVLLRLDARDLRAALVAEEARLAQADLELALERERQRTSAREWELLGDVARSESLALRRPHLAVAEANQRSAAAAVDRARLNLARTRLKAPFRAVVVSQNVEVGQVVGSQGAVVTLVGTDEVRVIANVPSDRLAEVDVPGLNAQEGAVARVSFGRGAPASYEGVVTGVVGQLDPQTRTAQLVVSVQEPFSGERPLLPGTFVEVEILGRPIDDAVKVPREAVVDGEAVWVVVEGRLERRPVRIGWRVAQDVVIIEGLHRDDQVVTSPLALPVEGQRVSVRPSVAARGQE
ncbi:MAG: efflux RND transporter periplasmic adaptor subunit [Deltaproteobacteria bacterium]|nr:MAG: efflux RND transporter periplasmic adaptor subunit [Deltaproteobacteria bacterium]